MRAFALLLLLSVADALRFGVTSARNAPDAKSSVPPTISRRALGLGVAGMLAVANSPARAIEEGLTLEDLPPKAQQAYNQYWPAIQLAGDFYVFELRELIGYPGRWDQIGALTETTNIGSAASVSKLDREFLTPMRILALSFPPDAGGEEMQEALTDFQAAMFRMSRQARTGQTTGNLADPSKKDIAALEMTWNAGASALNRFFEALNTATSTKRLVTIPANGVNYPRSKKLYTQLQKDAALCRNRGGEQLAGIWGNLMVYGTVPGVNPCGNVNLQNYFMQ
ncbi:hypothetical protein AB1Y20_020161 [Prymnesium parvum]|uniref:Uncharacterized protein n=1 Tax=Prymnesium parvum TaxID=97485 RepID=A0AB34JSS5_PRYPA|mmetsp:Transcript_18138/g.45485  ORF Transcript_18138/g.45485 Transcript_18138/m.45485 type:complete len:281 (+) Transcript_18138:24-866(+)